MYVQLRGDWPGNFHRAVRDDKGEILTVLEFSPSDRTPMLITDPLELAAIKNDLGKALKEVKPPVFVPDNSPVPADAPVQTAPKKPDTKKADAKKPSDIEQKPADDPPNPLQVQDAPKGA